jgi:hypothetical protein
MTLPTRLAAIVEALRNAGATEEMIAAVKASGEFAIPHSGCPGRPRQYATSALRDRAYRERKKARDEMRDETPARPLDTHVLSLEEVKAIHATARPPDASLNGVVVEAAHHNVDPSADIGPIGSSSTTAAI